MVSPWQHGRRKAAVAALLVVGILLSALASLPGAGAAGPAAANVQFIWNIPAPVAFVSGSLDGEHVAILDDAARFTFLLDGGDRQREWQTPNSGHLGVLTDELAEVPPVPLGVAMTPDGRHWAGAVAYDDRFAGRLYGFAHWSDEPIWRYSLPNPSWGQTAVRFTALAAGGALYAAGTTDGRVLLFRAGDEGSTTKTPYRTFTQSNEGISFQNVADVAVSRDGGLVLIGTAGSGSPTVHVFTEKFFRATFTRITEPVQQVAIAPEVPRGAAVTGTGANTRVHLLDLDKGRTIWERTLGAGVRDLAFSADGRVLAVATDNGRLMLFEERGNLSDSEPTRSFMFQGQVASVAVADDGYALAAATTNGSLHFLDATRPAPLWSYDLGGEMRGIALSGSGDIVAVGARIDEEGRLAYAVADHDLAHMVPPEPRLLPGPGQSIAVELANNGNRMARVAVEWRELPEGWVGKESNLSLAPGEQGRLPALIDVPRGQRADRYEIAFDLVAGPLRIPVEVTARVPEVTMGRTVKVWSFEHAVPGGGPAAFLFRLENLGNTQNEVAVGYSGLPAAWEAQFTGSTETRLRAGEDRQIALTVRAPHDAQKWRDVTFELVVAWQHGEERVPLRVESVEQAEYAQLILTIVGTGGGTTEEDDGVPPLIRLIQDEAARGPTSSAAVPGGAVGLGAVAAIAGGFALLIAVLVVSIVVLAWRRARSRGDGIEQATVRRK